MPLRYWGLLMLLCWPGAAMAQAVGDALSLQGATQTLDQEFRTTPMWRPGGQHPFEKVKPLSDPSFSWAAGYIWNHEPAGQPKPVWPLPTHDFPAWTSNTNANADPNGDMNARLGPLAALTWQDGILNFTARKMPDDIAATVPKIDPHGYMGASINSYPYAQRYGIFSIVAKVPKGKGLWPAFWLLPTDKTWPPEIDVMEILGNDTSTFYTTVHWKGDNGEHQSKGVPNHSGVDLSEGFHEYTVDWGPQIMNWYFDGKLVYSHPTPADLNKPCYIIANLAVGKADNWPGAPNASTVFPATMQVRSIRVWQRDNYQKQ